ncbi:MAG: polysaccharide biosynthesis protein [Planctomycetota bacterium]
MGNLNGKRVVVTGGTGSLGTALIHRLLSGVMGEPQKIIVFSRDEAKQHALRVRYLSATKATDEVIYRNFQRSLEFRIGDVRDFHSVSSVLADADVVFHAAALKQVPTCEYFPYEAVQTNIYGPENIVRAIRELRLPVETVIGLSTDKACKPVNVMGMTKALQERILVRANLDCPQTRFVCVRYGNVLASRGSVIPLFKEQINTGGPVTITVPEMTRFLLTLDQAVNTVLDAYRTAVAGQIYVPQIQSAAIRDIVDTLIGGRNIPVISTGIRPGEKLHEILVSEEEVPRTVQRGEYLIIRPVLPELQKEEIDSRPCTGEYSSAEHLMTAAEIRKLLQTV